MNDQNIFGCHEAPARPHTAPYWRLGDTGPLFKFIASGRMAGTGDVVVIVQGELSGEIFVHLADEFHDGRFKQVWENPW